MNFKKRVNGSWTDIPHYIHNTSTDTITTLPADIYANDTTATVGLKGNMEQNGTPTPDSPITPSECGEMTGNLCSSTNKSQTAYLRFYIKEIKEIVDDYDTFSLSFKTDVSLLSNTLYLHTTGNEQIAIVSGTGKVTKTFTLTSTQISNIKNATEPYIYIYKSNADFSNSTEEMLNVGETALPYEPYGVKIPISSANTTTPVYLGEVESTRRIKKLVLDGTEDWTQKNTGSGGMYKRVSVSLSQLAISNSYGLSSHYQYKYENADGNCYIGVTNDILYFIDQTNAVDVETWKTFLQQQYTNGTPVTVWYVLAEPTTGIVNEPLRKIGDYADEVSGITIPTIAGANTISVDTTLQPSEVTVNYHGWHPVQSVHEADNDEWD